MLAAEDEPPYDRPPLSKDVLVGRDVTPSLRHVAALRSRPAAGYPATGLARVRWRRVGRAGRRRCRPRGRCRPDRASRVLVPCGRMPTPAPCDEQLDPGAVVAIIGAGLDRRRGGLRGRRDRLPGHGVRGDVLAAGRCAAPKTSGACTAPGTSRRASTLQLGERVDDVTALGADVVVAGLGARPATGVARRQRLELRPDDGAVVVDDVHASLAAGRGRRR